LSDKIAKLRDRRTRDPPSHAGDIVHLLPSIAAQSEIVKTLLYV